jgi:integrase
VHSSDTDGRVLRIIGKGGKVRVVPLTTELASALTGAHGYVFPGKVGGHISPGRVGEILKAHLGEHWTGHTLRHRFATRAYAHTANMLAVRDLLGHSSVATTQRYTAIDDQALWDAIGGVA